MQLGARPHLERQQGPLAPRGFERSYMRYSRAYLAHLHHRPGPDEPEPEPMVKSRSLLTSQPCECTLTAVGPVKVLVLHGARQRLADYRAEEAANLLPPVVDMITYFNGNAQPNNFEARDLAAHDPMDQPPWVLQRLPPCVVQFDQRRDFYNLTSDGMSPRDYSTAFTVSVPADDGSSPCLASQISRIANYEIRDMFRNAQSRDSLARRGLCQRAGGWEQSVDPACDASPDPETVQLRKRRPLARVAQ